MARVAIVGVGAIGGVLASLLQSSGTHQITLCTRRPLNSLTVKTLDGIVHIDATNLTDPAQAKPVDFVLVATKAYDAAGAGAWLQRLCRQGAPAAILQNGVEHRERFTPYLPPAQILPVIVDCPVERKVERKLEKNVGSKVEGNTDSDTAIIHQRGPISLQLEDSPLAKSFADLFAGANATVTLTSDFLSPAWRKLCINSAGAIPAIIGKPSIVFHDEAIGQLTLALVSECAAVGKAEGAHLDPDIAQWVLDYYRRQPPDSTNSLLADRLAHRPMEIDARNGVIVRKGKQHNIPTPLNQMTVALLESIHKNT